LHLSSSILLLLQYFLWYGILGTLLGRKLMGLTRLARRLPAFVGQFLFGIPGSRLVLAGDNLPFAHSEEFIAVSGVKIVVKYVVTCNAAGLRL
jgi:hypothetical protein